jgi:hypothetical protein
VKSLEEQYLASVQTARARVEAVPDPAAREALEAVLESVSRLHMMLMKHESVTTKALFDMEGRMNNVLFNT